MIIDIIIPAFNEEKAIANVLQAIPATWVRHIFVCDNASTDNTAKVAKENGAIVVSAPQKGYGNACLRGLAHIQSLTTQPDIVVFMDGDFSDNPHELPLLIQPIVEEQKAIVIGSRVLGQAERGALQFQQRLGNALATTLIRWIYGYSFTDLGPFRAITYAALLRLQMQDKTFGWTVEMQIKAAKLKLPFAEIPVTYRKRIGTSKISGTVKGSLFAGYKILWTIWKYR